jgi:hypothetical protein
MQQLREIEAADRMAVTGATSGSIGVSLERNRAEIARADSLAIFRGRAAAACRHDAAAREITASRSTNCT